MSDTATEDQTPAESGGAAKRPLDAADKDPDRDAASPVAKKKKELPEEFEVKLLVPGNKAGILIGKVPHTIVVSPSNLPLLRVVVQSITYKKKVVRAFR